jgi:hypothetical protein
VCTPSPKRRKLSTEASPTELPLSPTRRSGLLPTVAETAAVYTPKSPATGDTPKLPSAAGLGSTIKSQSSAADGTADGTRTTSPMQLDSDFEDALDSPLASPNCNNPTPKDDNQ